MSYVGDEFDLQEIYIKLFGYVAPPFAAGELSVQDQLLPGSPLGAITSFEEQFQKTHLGMEMLMPLKIGIPDRPLWEVPTEPMVSVRGGHKIIRRFPNRGKKGGSIKERWSSDDFKITIKGFLIDFQKEVYPESQVKQLREVCEYQGSLKVENKLMNIFGIERMVIEGYDIPFTQGLPVQGYTINAYSDQLFNELLISGQWSVVSGQLSVVSCQLSVFKY